MVGADLGCTQARWNEDKLSGAGGGGAHVLCYGEDMQVAQEVMEGLLISRLETALLLHVC